ncbi:MAG: hypothetical protein M1308_15550 [Actinobacteria bacterium]|nr:hypothetical protein [Actinomycetota bacterium]
MKDSARDLFLKIINFEHSDRTLDWEFGYWGGTVKRWYKEGLPKVKGLPKEVNYGEVVFGPGLHWPEPSFGENLFRDFDISNYFNFDEGLELVPYNFWIYPKFEERIIFEGEKYLELYDCHGIRKKILKDNSSMPFYLDWPVKTKKDWEKIKEERFNLNTISERYVGDIDLFFKKIKNRTFPIAFGSDPIGFFGAIRFLVGEENLFLMYYDNPLLIKDILNHLCNLWINIAEELTSKIDFDVACFWEDMSGKSGSLISPATFREFMTPNYKRITDFIKSRGIKNCLVDTDGKVNELIPLFWEAGVNSMYPFERQAGNDLIEIRKNYPDLIMWGGFDKNTLFKGREYIDKEIEIIKILIKQGGYIPFADHLIPPNCSWENFKYYRYKLKDIIYSSKVLG